MRDRVLVNAPPDSIETAKDVASRSRVKEHVFKYDISEETEVVVDISDEETAQNVVEELVNAGFKNSVVHRK